MLARRMGTQQHQALHRTVGIPGAVVIGLGSILGTGVFVSLAIAAGPGGDLLPLAVVLAAVLASANGLSSAQLAAVHPVSGGTYEYGYRFLNPLAGFTAGWMFLCAKTASAATAALGFGAYFCGLAGLERMWVVPVAAGITVLVTLAALAGLRRTNVINAVVVSVTVFCLGWFIVVALGGEAAANAAKDGPPVTLAGFLEATALVFVAFTGYGRIATMGEEVRDPARTISRAVVLTLIVAALLYVGVALGGLHALGAGGFNALTTETGGAPLSRLLSGRGDETGAMVLAVGAMTAMLGVLLNLVLGLSRVWLAMGRRGDMPTGLARVSAKQALPVAAVVLTGVTVAALALTGSVRTTWTFSAFTVLVYYGITNVAALRLDADQRRYPAWIAVGGLVLCLGLAAAVETQVLLAGLGVIGIGIVWHLGAKVMQSVPMSRREVAQKHKRR